MNERKLDLADTLLADTMIRLDLRLVIEDHDGTVVQSGQVIHVASMRCTASSTAGSRRCGTSAPSRGFGCNRTL